MSPIFSIIIPVYNVAPYLRECLDSVLAQDFADFEVICVDDGSTDGSGVILDECSIRDNRFKVVHQKNSGVSAARNTALEISVGEWVLFLDADDILVPSCLKSLNDVVVRNGHLDIIQFGQNVFTTTCQPVNRNPERSKWLVVSSKCNIPVQFTLNHFQSKLYKRSIFKDVRFPDFIIGEDLVFLAKIIQNVDMMGFLDLPLYGYRIRPGSAMHADVSERFIKMKIAYSAELVRVIYSGRKKFPVCALRQCLNVLTEGVAYDCKVKGVALYKQVVTDWINALRSIVVLPGLPLFQKLRILTFINYECWPLAIVLFVLPFRIKMMGLHR